MGPQGQVAASCKSSAPRESVIVVMHSNQSKCDVEAVDWALKHVVRRGDDVIVLGVIDGCGVKATCFPFNKAMGFSAIWERLDCSTTGQELRPKELAEEIERKKQQCQSKLQPFYRRCKKNEVNLQVKLTFGCCPVKITVEQAQNSNPRWIILDSYLKKYKMIIYNQVGCNIAAMKGNDLATLIPSRNGQGGTSGTAASCGNQNKLNVPDDDDSSSTSRQASAGQSPAWYPLSWRSGVPQAFSEAELEVITNGFSKENVILEVRDGIGVYEGMLQGCPVLVRAFAGNDERFWPTLKILSRIRHRNIMNLVGHCCTATKLFLIFNYPCMGNLEINILVDDLAKNLPWKARWHIALDISGSLRHLHEECATDGTIVHLSVCSSYVTLSCGSITMLAYFASARVLKDERASNDDARTRQGNEERDQLIAVDIHDYGVLLIELISGMSARLFQGQGVGQSLIDWALPLLEKGSVDAVLDPRVSKEMNDSRMIQYLVNAALLCLRSNPSPGHCLSMSQVLAVVRGDQLAMTKRSNLLPPPPVATIKTKPSQSSDSKLDMEAGRSKEQIMDVRSVAEAVASAGDDDLDSPLYELESLCMRCGQNVRFLVLQPFPLLLFSFASGVTRLLLTSIPHFRKILLSAFECPHCDERNNEVQFAGEIQPRGCCYCLNVTAGNQKMLDRQVVKSESATIKIPELDFEIPPEAQRGSLSTLEGILMRAVDGLQALQEERRKVNPETAEAIDHFLSKLRACARGDSSFTVILDDPAGNSFIENPCAPSPDPALSIKFYDRTPEQQASLGYMPNPTQPGVDTASAERTENDNANPGEVEPHGSIGAVAGHRAIAQSNSSEISEALFRYTSPEEVMTFPSTCGACAVRSETRMFVTSILDISSGLVSLKPGGAIPEKGKKITLCVKNVKDLSRDVIKSDTAGVTIPELDLELTSGTLGGLVTTVEGLVTNISESLERVHGFTFGDSLEESRKSKWLDFRSRLIKILNLEKPFTLILDDALANSFIAPATDDLKDDQQLIFEEYERSFEQNEELGLNDLDTSSADAAYNASSSTAAVEEEK
ncbi:unnamed protein product [Linum tenue]|uniref:Zinc finger ZPR1-type domain-containing protein n=1 Tax=Linum tenue TaxID=586396 RepID=A0AAV0LZ95_9ROSI|nr:unnamed protein product [Linum tenue]